jgi:glutaconate CoA-transferase subunit A
MPVRGFIGSDYLHARPDFKVIQDPFTGEEVVVVPPITPDVALIHALKGDAQGNLLVDRIEDDHLLAQASQRVIASVEEIVPAGTLAETPGGLFVSGLYVTALVHAPCGAYPTACRGYYAYDPVQISSYVEAAKTPEAFRSYLDALVCTKGAITQPSGVYHARTVLYP